MTTGFGLLGQTVRKTVLPKQPQTQFERQLEDWQRRAEEARATREARVKEIQATPYGGYKPESLLTEEQMGTGTVPKSWTELWYRTFGQIGKQTQLSTVQEHKIQQQITDEILGLVFYEDLYTTVPALVASGAANSIEEALSMISVPPSLSQDELASIRDDISRLLASRDIRLATPEMVSEEAAEGIEGIVYPELVAPVTVQASPVTISQLSSQEIVKALRAPEIPESALSKTEWTEHLQLLGWSEEDIDQEDKLKVEQLVAEVQNKKNLVESVRTESMKDLSWGQMAIGDFLKTSIGRPSLAALEMLNVYYEHVSKPAAGFVYGQISDIRKAAEEFRQANPDASEREALVYAWDKWDAPGPNWTDFILKYMLMEGIVDPTTYLGWGIVTKMARPLGPVGRGVAAGNKAIGEMLDIPFDLVKAGWAKLPKTVGQQATVLSNESYSILTRGFELVSGKPLTQMLPSDMAAAGEQMLKHLVAHPRAEDDIALAARQLLIHQPVSEKEAGSWIARLKGRGLQTLDSAELAKGSTLLDTDSIFEHVFNKEITVEEAAPLLLQKLGVENFLDASEDAYILAGRLLSDRANLIFDRALDFTALDTSAKALRAYRRKAEALFKAIGTSEVQREALKGGLFRNLFLGLDRHLVKLWPRKIEQFVIRDAAQTYLTFGGYGPMNVLEDIWRSTLGGVRPGRSTIEQTKLLTFGLKDDPNLYHAGLSETFGPLAESGTYEAARTNWIMTLSTAPLTVPTWAVTAGKVTPARATRAIRRGLVDFWGGMGADLRRNGRDGRYLQILADSGGETYQQLLKAGPKNIPSELASAPKWLKTNLKSNVRNAKLTGHFTPDNKEMIGALKSKYTRNRVVRAEIDDIIKRYPDISPTSRSLLFDEYRQLMRSPDSIDDFMKNTVMKAEEDDFLKSPERATDQMRALADELTALEVQRPEEMARLIQSLHRMTQAYGAMPNQLMARATVRSRGMNAVDRSSLFDMEFERLQTYIERAAADIDRVVDKISTADVGSTQFKSVAQQYLDTATALRQEVSAAHSRDIAYRQDYFGKASKKDRMRPEFWEDFYAHEQSFWNNLNKKVATLNSRLAQLTGSITESMGVKVATRKPVVVKGRPLAPADVAQLIGGRGDDVSRMLLDTMIPEGDRDYFIEYIMGTVREGYDVGFTRESVGAVYDQICQSMMIDPKSASWYRARQMQLDSMARDFHDLYNAKLFPREQKLAVDSYIDEAAKASGAVTNLAQSRRREIFERIEKLHGRAFAEVGSTSAIMLRDVPRYQTLMQEAQRLLREEGFDLIESASTGEPFRTVAARTGREGIFYSDAPATEWGREVTWKELSFQNPFVAEDQIGAAVQLLGEEVTRPYRARLAKLNRGLGGKLSTLGAKVGSSEYRVFYDELDKVLISKAKAEGYDGLIYHHGRGKLFGEYVDFKQSAERVSALGGKAGNYDALRQSALDEANKWFYKEFTDYTNANVIDAIMKVIFPFWTYESRRWPWLFRSFIRHPGTLTAWGRWENNTDYGYIHIPGTAIDVNPLRGTVYGPWSTRLLRKDYPEYYDQLEAAGGFIEFQDAVSRFGFYPNVIYGAALAHFGGAESQTGGVLPSVFNTPLNAMIAAFPDNKLVSFISESIFPEMFRQYLTARRVDDFGGDGSLLYAKRKAGQALTPEEEQLWTDARASVATHSALFEQTGMMRMRDDQAYAVSEAAAQFIEETWGVTREQQKYARLHNEKIWDRLGGLDPWESAVLQELDFFKYSGSINPVLPSHQQEILNRIEIDWADVRAYSEQQQSEILKLQQDFLSGSERGRLSPDAFLGRVRELYEERRRYIEQKVKDNPLMLLENRVEYYEKYSKTMPVQSPYNELMSMYFDVELEDTIDPGTGERIYDWDKFWAQRGMIEEAIPAVDKGQWDAYITRNTAPLMTVWHDSYNNYLRKYYDVWGAVLGRYSEEEQQLINEYLYLERTGQQLERQATIQEMESKGGNRLVSEFRSEVASSREALRYANPHLDAWLFYWGRVKSFQTAQAEQVYRTICKQTGRVID